MICIKLVTYGQHQSKLGQPPRLLAELKVINAGPTWYPQGSTAKAVDRRASRLEGEYRSALGKLDRQFHGTAPNEAGPLKRRLEELHLLQPAVRCFD